MKRYKVLRIISVVMVISGAAIIILNLVEGEKSVFRSIGAGGAYIGLGGAFFGMSLRFENREKASDCPSNTPK